MFFACKVLLTALIVALVSTVARRQPALGALIASLPLVSVLGMAWLWIETHDAHRLETHAAATFWYVLPSLPMFLALPAMLRAGVPFWPALLAGCLLTVVLYAAVAALASSR